MRCDGPVGPPHTHRQVSFFNSQLVAADGEGVDASWKSMLLKGCADADNSGDTGDEPGTGPGQPPPALHRGGPRHGGLPHPLLGRIPPRSPLQGGANAGHGHNKSDHCFPGIMYYVQSL